MLSSSSIHKHTKKFIGKIVVSLCFFSVLLSQPLLAAQAPLRIDYVDFPPFYTQEHGKMTGFFYEIVTEALDRMHIKATWQNYPWGRCQEHVKEGKADAILTVPTPARLIYTETHSDPFYLKKLTIFTYANHPRMEEINQLKTIDDIFNANLSVITYIGNGWSNKNIRNRGIKTYETPQLQNVWPMLAHKRGDLVIEWPGSAWPHISKSNVQDSIIQTEVSLQSLPFHLIIGKKSPYTSILPLFNQTILQMKKDGTINHIVSDYIKQFHREYQ